MVGNCNCLRVCARLCTRFFTGEEGVYTVSTPLPPPVPVTTFLPFILLARVCRLHGLDSGDADEERERRRLRMLHGAVRACRCARGAPLSCNFVVKAADRCNFFMPYNDG